MHTAKPWPRTATRARAITQIFLLALSLIFLFIYCPTINQSFQGVMLLALASEFLVSLK